MDVQDDNISIVGRRIEYNEEKNLLLKATRGVGFPEVIETIQKGKILADLEHHQELRQHQRILVIKINNYAYAVPYVYDKEKGTAFLKTIFPSRELTKKYLKR